MSLLPHQIEAGTQNGKLWNHVSTTYPSSTKRVSQGGRTFTAIDAYAQIKRATEVFGAVGEGWGWNVKELATHGDAPNNVIHATIEVWYIMPNLDTSDSPFEAKRCSFDSVGCAVLTMQPRGKEYWRTDADAGKKAVTDAITKALSFIGFNVDVFFGAFDDNKYVEAMEQAEREARDGASQPKPAAQPQARETKPQAEPAEQGEKPGGPPAPGWFTEKLGGDGRFAAREWGWMIRGGVDGGRHRWLRAAYGLYRSEKILKRIAWILATYYSDEEAINGTLKSGLQDDGAGHANPE